MFEENYLFHVPEQKRIKVILDSDVRNEVDDQFAIMHALMTPKFDVRGVTQLILDMTVFRILWRPVTRS